MDLVKEFQELKNGSQFVVGTCHEKRSLVWSEFIKDYPDMVFIRLDGVDIELRANTSISGKNTSYFGNITPEQYKLFVGSHFGLKANRNPFISIQGGVIEISGGGKFYCKISNSRISDLLPF